MRTTDLHLEKAQSVKVVLLETIEKEKRIDID